MHYLFKFCGEIEQFVILFWSSLWENGRKYIIGASGFILVVKNISQDLKTYFRVARRIPQDLSPCGRCNQSLSELVAKIYSLLIRRIYSYNLATLEQQSTEPSEIFRKYWYITSLLLKYKVISFPSFGYKLVVSDCRETEKYFGRSRSYFMTNTCL